MSLIDDTFIIKEDMEVRCLGTLSNEVLAKDLAIIKTMMINADGLPFFFTKTPEGRSVRIQGGTSSLKMSVPQLLNRAREFDVNAWTEVVSDRWGPVYSIEAFIQSRGTMECSDVLENAMNHEHMTTRNLVSQWQTEVDERVRFGYMAR